MTTLPQDINLGRVRWGDFDSNGNPDLLVTGDNDDGEGVTRLFYNVTKEVP